MKRLLLISLIGLSCRGTLSNAVDSRYLICGNGYKKDMSFVKIKNETELFSYSKDTLITENGCIERPNSGQIFITNAERTKGTWISQYSGEIVELEKLEKDDFPFSNINIRFPEVFQNYETTITFTPSDGSSSSSSFSGKLADIKVPIGSYFIAISLRNKKGDEHFHSCDLKKIYRFSKSLEQPIIDICRQGDNVFTSKTLDSEVTSGITPIITELPTPQATGDDISEIQETPLFIEERTCFGLPASYSRDGSEIIIKMSGSITNHLFDLTNAPKCTLLTNIPKDFSQGYSPIYYRLKFSSDAETIRQNFFLSVLAKDDNGLLALPCKSILLSNLENSDKPYQCSYYDTSEEKFLNMTDRNKEGYEKLCKARSNYIKFDFRINGIVDNLLTEMTISELRIQAPLPEKCIRPTN